MNSVGRPAAEPASEGAATPVMWELALYIAGQTPRCIAACANLTQICEEYLPGCYAIEVIDLLENPQRARQDQILAVPTLVRRAPGPQRKVIGDLSNTEKVLSGLELPGRGTHER